MKGKTTTTTQTFRYSKNDWTEERARAHCEEQKGSFHPAGKSMTEDEKEIEKLIIEFAEKEFDCECIECGYKMKSEKHCDEIKCPKCGGQMRRVERPGPGKALASHDIDSKELIAVGTWNTMSGKLTIKEEDVDEIMKSYNDLIKTGIRKIPIKLGHDKDQKLLQKSGYPSAGWVENLRKKVKNGVLKIVGDLKAIPDKVYKIIQNKGYVNVSPELSRNFTYLNNGKKYKWLFNKLALLGIDQPAQDLDELIKAYAQEGSKDNEIVFNLSEPNITEENYMAEMKTEDGIEYPAEAYAYVPDPKKPSTWKLRLWESPTEKVTKAQLGRAAAAFSPGGFRGRKVEIPPDDVAKVKAKIVAAYRKLGVEKEDIPKQLLSEKPKQEEEMVELEKAKARIEELETKAKEYGEEKVKLQQSLDEAEEKLTTAEKEKKETEIAAFIDGAIEKGKILPAQKDNYMQILLAMPEDTYKFSDNGEEKEGNALDLIKSIVETNPNLIELGEFSEQKEKITKKGTESDGTPMEDVELAAKVAKVEKEEKISYEEAYELLKERGEVK